MLRQKNQAYTYWSKRYLDAINWRTNAKSFVLFNSVCGIIIAFYHSFWDWTWTKYYSILFFFAFRYIIAFRFSLGFLLFPLAALFRESIPDVACLYHVYLSHPRILLSLYTYFSALWCTTKKYRIYTSPLSHHVAHPYILQWYRFVMLIFNVLTSLYAQGSPQSSYLEVRWFNGDSACLVALLEPNNDMGSKTHGSKVSTKFLHTFCKFVLVSIRRWSYNSWIFKNFFPLTLRDKYISTYGLYLHWT